MRPWILAWQDALYGARGFYRMPTGPAGHFATSCHGPRAVPFAEALLRLATAESVGRIIDIGAGRGELLSAIAGLAGGAEGPGAGIDLVGVDVVARPAGLATRIDWIESPGGAELPDLGRPEAALVVANEWLDVIPCPVLEADADGRLREIEVDDSGRERLGLLAGESATVGGPVRSSPGSGSRWGCRATRRWRASGRPSGAGWCWRSTTATRGRLARREAL